MNPQMLNYKTETLVDFAYKTIKMDIAQRELAQGQKIVIRELQERYGLSATPIKQALNRLVTEGLVESIPRRGMRVREIKWEEIEDLMDLRSMIETHYIPHAIAYVKEHPELIQKFRANIAEHMQIVESRSDVDKHLKNYSLDAEFHQLFIRCSGNKRVIHFFSSLGTHDYSYFVYGKQDREGRVSGVIEHQAIIDALEDGDEDGVRQAMDVHLLNAKTRLHDMFLNDTQTD